MEVIKKTLIELVHDLEPAVDRKLLRVYPCNIAGHSGIDIVFPSTVAATAREALAAYIRQHYSVDILIHSSFYLTII